MHSVLHALRSGPMAAVYRDALRTERKPLCTPSNEKKCEVGVRGFGSVGTVEYNFDAHGTNAKGRSTQVMIACMCIGRDCIDSILIRPVHVEGVDTCLFMSVDNEFVNCQAELLRSVQRDADDGVTEKYSHGNYFKYNVNDIRKKTFWNAEGERGYARNCTAADFANLPVLDLDTLNESSPVSSDMRAVPEMRKACQPPPGVTFYRPATKEQGTQCGNTYKYAASAATHRASLQDSIATGNDVSSYFEPKPPLVSNTELTLTCSAAVLGVIFVYSQYSQFAGSPCPTTTILFATILFQFVSFMLEALPLHMALFAEFQASKWITEFAFLDASLALGSDQLSDQGSARGSVLILTSLLGTVGYQYTRRGAVAALTAAFDLVALFIVCGTVWHFLGEKHDQTWVWRRKRGRVGRVRWGRRRKSDAARGLQRTEVWKCSEEQSPGASEGWSQQSSDWHSADLHSVDLSVWSDHPEDEAEDVPKCNTNV